MVGGIRLLPERASFFNIVRQSLSPGPWDADKSHQALSYQPTALSVSCLGKGLT